MLPASAAPAMVLPRLQYGRDARERQREPQGSVTLPAALPPSPRTVRSRRVRTPYSVASFSCYGLSGLRARAVTPTAPPQSPRGQLLVPVVPFRRNPASMARCHVDWTGLPGRFRMYKRSDGLARAVEEIVPSGATARSIAEIGSRDGWTCDWQLAPPDAGVWVPYGPAAASALSTAYKRGRTGCGLSVAGQDMWVDFVSMEQREHLPPGFEPTCPSELVRQVLVPPASWLVASQLGSSTPATASWSSLTPDSCRELDLLYARWAAGTGAAEVAGVAVSGCPEPQFPDFSSMSLGPDLRLRRVPADPVGERLLAEQQSQAAQHQPPPASPRAGFISPTAVTTRSRGLLREAQRHKDEILALRAEDHARKIETWSAQKQSKLAWITLTQAEVVRRKTIRDREEVLREQFVVGLAARLEDAEVSAARAKRIEARRARQARRREEQLRVKRELERRHAAEREVASQWDVGGRCDTERDELKQREILIRRLLDRAHASQTRQWGQQAKLNLARVRRAQLERERAEATREREWLDLFLLERGRRAEVEDEEGQERGAARFELTQGIRALRDEERRVQQEEEERLRMVAELMSQERASFVGDEQRHRLGLLDREAKAFSAVLAEAQKSRDRCNSIEEGRREVERVRIRQMWMAERGVFATGEEKAREEAEQDEVDARVELRVLEEVARELAKRPIDLHVAPRGQAPPPPAQWVYGQLDAAPVLVCPMAIVRRKLWAPLGSSNLRSVVMHCTVAPEQLRGGDDDEGEPTWAESSEVLEIQAAEVDPNRIRAAQTLQIASGVVYKPATDPPLAIAKVGQPDDSVHELGLPASPGAIRLEFTPAVGLSVDVTDVETVLRALTLRSQSSDGPRQLKVQIYVYCVVDAAEEALPLQPQPSALDWVNGAPPNRDTAPNTVPCDLDMEVPVDVVPPLLALPPHRGNLLYNVTALSPEQQAEQRPPLQLIQHVSMPGLHSFTPHQRQFDGGAVVVRFAEGVTVDDNVFFDEELLVSFDKCSGVVDFEGQEARVRSRTQRGDGVGQQQVVCKSPGSDELSPSMTPEQRRGGKKGRRLSNPVQPKEAPAKQLPTPAPIVSLSTSSVAGVSGMQSPRLAPEDYGMVIEFPVGSDWPETRVRRLLYTLYFDNQAAQPTRPKRVLEFTLHEGSNRDPSRTPVKSVINVEVAVLYRDDPTFWVVCDDDGVIKGHGAPFAVYRGSHLAGPPPKHREFLNCSYTTLFPEVVIQNQHHMDKFRGGHMLIMIVSGAAPGDTLCLNSSFGILQQGESLFVDGVNLAKVTSSTLAQLQIPQLRVDFNSQKPLMEFPKVQDLMRLVCFTNTSTTPRLGERIISAEVYCPDAQCPRAEPLRCTISLRVLQPSVEVTVSSAFCGYTEDQGWKKLANFNVPQSDKPEEDLLNVFDGGEIRVQVVDGVESDSFALQQRLGHDVFVEETEQQGRAVHIIRMPSVLMNEPPEIVAQYEVPRPDEPLVIKLGAGTAPTVHIDDDGALQFVKPVPVRGTPPGTTGTPARPLPARIRVLSRQLRAILNSLHFRNDSEHSIALQKMVSIEVTDSLGALSQAIVEVEMTRVNDPTEIILQYPKVSYRQGTASVQNGLPLCPGAEFIDVDTTHATPGAYMTIELVSGDPSQDSLSVGLPAAQRSGFFTTPQVDPGALELDGATLLLGGKPVGTVSIREKTTGRGPLVAFNFTSEEGVPLEKCAEVLSAVRYHNNHHPVKGGVRTYAIKFNAGEDSTDTRVRVEVEVLPPIVWTPTFATSMRYKEGSGGVPVNQKILSGIPSVSRLAGARIKAEIVSNFSDGEDRLGFKDANAFEVDGKGKIKGLLPGAKGHFIGMLTVAENGQHLHIDFPPDCQSTVKILGVIFRAITYENVSKKPTTLPRKVHLMLDAEASGPCVGLRPEPPKPPPRGGRRESVGAKQWPTEGQSTGLVEVTIDIMAVDDLTVCEPASQAVVHMVGQVEETMVLSGAKVDDEDTPFFNAPHAFVSATLQNVYGGDRIAAPDHTVMFSDRIGVDVVGDVVTVDGVEVGRSHNVGNRKGVRVDLDNCSLDHLRRLVHSIAYRFHGSIRARVAKYQMEVCICGGRHTEVTRARVMICIVPKSFELHPGFHESGCQFMYLNGVSRTPLNIAQNANLLSHVTGVSGAVLEVRFGGIRAPEGEGYVPPLGPFFLSGPRRKSVTTPSASPRVSTVSMAKDTLDSPQTKSRKRSSLSAVRSAARAIGSSIAFMRRSSAFSWTKAGAEQNAPDFPDRGTDTLTVKPQQPLKLSRTGDTIFHGKERLATVEQIDDQRGTHGLRITLAKSPKVTLAHLDSLFHSLWYEHKAGVSEEDAAKGGRRIIVRVGLSLPIHDVERSGGQQPVCETVESYCIRVQPGLAGAVPKEQSSGRLGPTTGRRRSVTVTNRSRPSKIGAIADALAGKRGRSINASAALGDDDSLKAVTRRWQKLSFSAAAGPAGLAGQRT